MIPALPPPILRVRNLPADPLLAGAMRALLPIFILTLLLPAVVCAQGNPPTPEPPPFDPGGWLPGGGDDDTPEPEEPKAANDASSSDFKRAMELQKQGKWKAAQKAFRTMLDKFPESSHKSTAEARSDDNAFLGCELIHKGGQCIVDQR